MATVTRSTVEMVKLKVQISGICFLVVVVGLVSGQVLTPPYFNLASGRPIEATATCGVGVSEPELFCKLTGANPDKKNGIGDFEVIQGQLCDKCNLSDHRKIHSPEFAVDGTERWWQSPPLSRGFQYNEVNLTIHLQQEFHVAYVYIKMGNSPRPGVFAIERSRDHGKTWQPWQFFADTPSDCSVFFGREGYSDRIVEDDSVICATNYSTVVPLEDGEVTRNAPGFKYQSHGDMKGKGRGSLPLGSLQEWTKATDIRLRLLRTATLHGHLMGVDPTITRRYYYSIKDISIGSVCICFGHASDCDITVPVDTTKLVCRCQHNTCGEQCETCCPGFVQKPWRPATQDAINVCEPCQCHGHSEKCRYDPEVDRARSSVDIHGQYEGGGVCINCLHNTMGINCEQCKPGYFRTSNTLISSTRACQRCRCDRTYSTGNCMDGTGRCLCKPGYGGANCDRCNDGYYGYPLCIPCHCYIDGTEDGGRKCEGGQCRCKPNFNGIDCSQCAFDNYDFPECKSCDCDIIGSHGTECDVRSGQCHCRTNYGGRNCGSCANGYYNYPACDSCNCDHSGATAEVCDKDYGRCICKEKVVGPRCEHCASGYLNWPKCFRCRCDLRYSTGNCIEGTDQCVCKPEYAGANCDRCNDGYHSYPLCIPCHCHIDGTEDGGCNCEGGQCRCKSNFNGIDCSQCAFDYYKFPECRSCDCDIIGSHGTECDVRSGQCHCRTNYDGRECGFCASGYYNYPACDSCNCNENRVIQEEVCDKDSGRCICKENFSGPRCERCAPGYFNWPQCIRCSCLSHGGALTCDPLTGECHCLPGVTGPDCDQCLPRWIMIPGFGCNECDNCHNLLLDDIEVIDYNITSMRRELASVSVGILASHRLEEINQTVAELRPLVVNLPTDPSQLNRIEIERYQVPTLATEVKTKSSRTLRESDLVESDADDVKRRAENLYQDLVQMAMKEATEAVDFVKEVLKTIQGGDNMDELLRQSERMLKEIRSRGDFSFSESAVEEELGKARDTLKQAKELMDRVTGQFHRTVDMRILIDDIWNKMRDLQNSSHHSLNHSQAAIEINHHIRQLMKLVTDTNHKIGQTETDIRNFIDRSRRLLSDARKFLTNASQAYTEMERVSSQLDGAVSDLNPSMVELSRENRILIPLVDNATQHALRLRTDADLLESLMVDTRAIAEAALNASEAYRTITDAINGALNASIEALRVAEEASVMSSGLANNATESGRQSEILKGQADNITAAALDLNMRLANVKKTLEEVRKINIQIKDECVTLVSGLDGLPAERYEAKARKATTKANNAKKRAENVEDKIKKIVDRLPEYQRKLTEIEKDVNHSNRIVRRAKIEVNQTISLVPDINYILSRLSNHAVRIRQLGRDLKTQLMLLRNNVSVARDQANLIRVGMDFRANSSLQVRNPRNLIAAGVYSRVSLYFKTTSNDGLLFYAGPTQRPETQMARNYVTNVGSMRAQGASIRAIVANYDEEKKSKTVADWNYMALQLIGGKAVFKFDLGSGEANITIDKSVSDGVWREAIMSRSGRNGTLTIRTPNEENFTAEGRSDGESLVLNFDNTSRVFIGGITTAEKNDLEDILSFINFTGCIQDVSFDGAAVGLWNFVSAENVTGCISRDVSNEPRINGYMFGGNGYVILERLRFNPAKETLVKFSFRTFAGEGLLFLMGMPDKDFLSVELNDGKVIYKYDLGSGLATIASTQRYNDGQWHAVVAKRAQQDGMLAINSSTVDSRRSPGTYKDLDIDNNTYFGGFKGTHTYSNASVTQKGFEGCIKDIELGTRKTDITDHIEAKDVLPGCSESIVRVISFISDVQNSYIRVDSVNIDETFEMSMKFKTVENDGLLSYITDDMKTQSSAFSLSLSDGKVFVKNIVEGSVTALQSRYDTYNDGRWHYLTVRKDGTDMSLHIDDSDMTSIKVEGKPRTITNSSLFFGGFPSTLSIIPENVSSSTPFVGCIGDVTIRQQFINFASLPPDNMAGAVLSSCHIPDPTPNATSFTIVIPPFPIIAPGATRVLPSDSCFLPVEPAEPPEETETGYRFGSQPYSRQEYIFPSVSVNRANYSVQFKTTSSKGVLFYVANKRHVHFVGIYINNGLVSAAFNCGGGVARATTAKAYNDGQWHNLVFERNLTEGTLTIDEGAETVSVTASGTSRSIRVIAPYFVGGLPPDFSSNGASNLENVSTGFVGCLKNFLQDGKEIGEPKRVEAVDKCTSSAEVGTFFYADAGHIVLSDNFSVGLDLDITLEIKPRTLSGVLLSVHNQGRGSAGGDYLVLQMVNGEVIFSMDNGRGDVSAIYTPPAKNQLCDGKWHTIRAQKVKNGVVLEVDSVYRSTSPGAGDEGVSRTNTEGPFYVGGVPEVLRGIRTKDRFVGCMRRLELNEVAQDFSQSQAVGRIKLDSCPIT